MAYSVTNFWLVPAHFSVLFFLGGLGAAGLLLASAAVLGLLGRRRFAAGLAAAGASVPALYLAVLLAVGRSTPERTIAVGRGKWLCDLDCHLVYSVSEVGFAPDVSGRRVVRIVTHFDETTVAPWRGDAPLSRCPGTVELVDGKGRRFPTVTPGGPEIFGGPLRPGESREADLAFDVPADARGLRLWVGVAEWPARLLIGSENAPLAGKALLALPF